MNSVSIKQRLLLILFLAATGSLAAMSNRANFKPEFRTFRYMVSANDQKFLLTDGLGKVMEHPLEGTVTILDFSVFPPIRSDISNVPCSVIGPPTCAAITPDEKLALIAVAMKVDPANPSEQISDNRLTVIDLDGKRVLETLVVGNQPSGISISPDGGTALVCNRADGTVTSLRIENKKVSIQRTLGVCRPDESLSHIAISPDNRFALATLNQAQAALRIPLKNGIPQTNIERIELQKGPYCVEFTSDGKMAAVANTMSDSVSILKVDNGKVEVKDTVKVAILPEGIDISPDGRWMLACCMNNTTLRPDDPNRQNHGYMVLLKRHPNGFSEVQRIEIDRIPQSAVFAPDSKYVVVAGFENRRLRFYRLENETLEDTGVIMDVPGQPCTLRTAN